MKKAFELLEQRLIRYIRPDRFLPIQLDITNLCNLRCQHCYHPDHRNDGALSLKNWIEVLNQYQILLERIQFDPQVIFCGGEPLLSPMLGPLLAHVRNQNRPYRVSIVTNGTLATRFNFAHLEGLGQVQFQVSLDGPNADSHNQARGKDSFEQTLRGIKAIRNHGHPVSLLAILSERTAALIPHFFDLAKSLGIESMGFTRLIATGSAEAMVSSQLDRPLEPLELRDAMRTILLESARTRVPSSPQQPLYRLIHPRLGRSGRFAEGVVVDYRGNILASSRSRLVLGHVFKDGIENILLSHPVLKAIRRGEIEVCGACPYYQRCGGDRNAAYAYSGNYLGPDPGCWLHIENQMAQFTKRTAI